VESKLDVLAAIPAALASPILCCVCVCLNDTFVKRMINIAAIDYLRKRYVYLIVFPLLSDICLAVLLSLLMMMMVMMVVVEQLVYDITTSHLPLSSLYSNLCIRSNAFASLLDVFL
jgi:hypothetical protein